MGISNFYEQQTKKFTGTVKVNGSVQDITSDTITLLLYDNEGVEQINKEADTSLGDGQYEVILTTTDTDLKPGNYDYEIWWKLSSGEEYPLEKRKN